MMLSSEGCKECISFDYTYADNSAWKELIAQYLQGATTFEIHCWNEEKEQLKLALKYGNCKDNNWTYGKVMQGKVTPAFTEMVLNLPKPTDTQTYNKMTPFFGLFLDSGLCSEHYGTEIYI